MPVYVDAPIWSYGRMKMCHMIADTTEELLAMADRIGVQRKWIQYPGTHKEHFDVCLSKRRLAVQDGAIEVSWRQFVEIWERKRKNEKDGAPVCSQGNVT